jgi:Heterokaryon incompatibility protein (HET)
MAAVLPNPPLRLLRHSQGNFSVFDPRHDGVDHFDILSYTWGPETQPWNCEINGVDWDLIITSTKLEDIKRLMVSSGVQYLWVDCLCINQADESEKSAEMSKMFDYYRSARMCYILIDLPDVWKPQDIVDNLQFIDHILSHMHGAALASEAKGLTQNLTNRLAWWANAEWTFDMDKSKVRAAAIDMGVLNCYSTCISNVRSVFQNLYFTRVWTFQEMLLGNNITMWGINPDRISCIGELHIWMDLAIDSKDKAYKLQTWIDTSRVLKTASVNAILRIIEEDHESLDSLQTQVKGISCARTDIINGGPEWWKENYKGISNIFSAISIMPRKCKKRADIFRGLLGVFSGLFTPEEIKRDMSGDDLGRISFAFFKQLSTKTERAWTKLAISSRERGEWDWIPVEENNSGFMTTDCFAGVVDLGRLKQKGQAKAIAMTGIDGVPRKYMKIRLSQENTTGFRFVFKGCNCGKEIKTGVFSSEPIPTNDQPRNVVKDETGRMLVQCATILGSIMDPGGNIIDYRRRLLSKLQPVWNVNDPNAKPTGWIDRCVSGTPWEDPSPVWPRAHNMSMNYRMVDITSCKSRLANESTERISCEVVVNCGCTIVAPFSLIFEAITAVEGSFLGDASATLDKDNRIVLKDGLGLVQVGDIGRTFSLVSFGGDIDSHRSYSSSCKSTKRDKPVYAKLPWPRGRALVRQEFTHDLMDMTRDYGYVETGGSGNLLICRNHPLGQYKIIGVCIDEYISNKKGEGTVIIR